MPPLENLAANNKSDASRLKDFRVTSPPTSVRVVQDGPKLTVYIDGEKDLEAEDATFPKGTIALYSWGSTGVRFRNIILKPKRP